MAVKNLSTRVAIIGRGAKCRGGSSAVDKSAYISRTTMYSEYDGTTYYPKYTEDLVHNEVMLPVNAPAEYSDPSVLWNSVEMRESKSAKAQLARSYKINLPNEWSYELAIEVMRDYVKRNFVDDGMCAQFAIHDSENPNTHQRKLVNSKPVEAVRNTANEVLDMIRAVVGKKGRLELPVIKSKYVRKISQRQALQEQDRMERFVVANQIESFEQLQEFKTQREPAYEKLSAERQQIAEQIARLEQLLVAYSEYEPYIVYHKTSNSLKGFAKRKYDKEHETELRDYDSYRAELKKMLSSDEKITPKKWTAEKTKLEERLQESNPDYARVVTELASTEVIEHNRKMLAMTREAEKKQHSQIHSRKKNEQSL